MVAEVIVGIDVSAETLDVAVEVAGEQLPVEQFSNDAKGHDLLARWLTKSGKSVRVVLESTGVYSLDVTLALYACEAMEVMVANPRALKDFTRATMQRSKSDAKDAASIREFAKRMPFVPWQPPAEEALELREIARRISALTVERSREKNRQHAGEASESGSRVVLNDIEVNIRHLERRIDLMTKHAVDLVKKHTELQRAFKRLTSVKGIAESSAVQILPELLVLPSDMTVRQWVAHCGLDPREFKSGSSVEKPTRISRVGNVRLRRALFIPALVASRFEPRVKAFYEKLLANGKKPLQALVAVMRKLLHAIYGMLKTDSDFDGEKFYACG
jgi:transposase